MSPLETAKPEHLTSDPEIATALTLFARMQLIRAFEEQAIELFAKGLISGSTHPCIGQEAIAVGACSALEPGDQLLATYRGHGAALAKGCDPMPLMAELLTRVDGCCKGRGGSMHLCDASRGLLGTNAIVAAHIPIAGGVALSAKLRANGQVVMCFFGDGASCEGEFYETLNMAALWKVPLVFVCENNGYAISVPTTRSQATPDIADRARGFGIRSTIVDGNDLRAVRAAALDAVAAARHGEGPCFIECKTVRWERHSAFSAGRYEHPAEAQRWKTVDPLPRFADHLRTLGLEADRLASIEAQARETIAGAVARALASPQPPTDSIWEGIYADASL